VSADGGAPQILTNDPDLDTDPSWSPDGVWIAFVCAKNHHLQIQAMHPDGTARKVLVADDNNNRLPVWSPDGRRIAFNRELPGQRDAIYVMESDGTLPRRVTDGKSDADEAAWLPNGRGLVFETNRDGNLEIYRMRLPSDPDGAVRLTNNIADDEYPSWSPDGKWIAFQSNRDGKSAIYLMDPDGGQIRSLTAHLSADENPAWSPDGTKIAFASDRDGRRGIFTMNPDGGDVQRITAGSNDSLPSWSGDGHVLCFIREERVWLAPMARSREGHKALRDVAAGDVCALSSNGKQVLLETSVNDVRELRRLDVDSGAIAEVTHNARSNGTPAWSRDGSRIAFNSNGDGYNFGIFVLNAVASAAGTAPTRLTARDSFDGWPSWSPDGRWIVFETDRDGNNEIYKIAVP
jgi:TolB protein